MSSSDDLKNDDLQYVQQRMRMVADQIRARGITDQRILDAFEKVPRHLFVPEGMRESAYADTPLPIGYGQTISQPYIVALMTDLAQLEPSSRVLDVGTGCGYQAAILGELCAEVYSIEIIEPLATSARRRLESLGYQNVIVRHGDGYAGWPEEQPFDAIIGAAAPPDVPQSLVDQLAPGAQLILPVGELRQELLRIEKLPDGSTREYPTAHVSFVPMTRA